MSRSDDGSDLETIADLIVDWFAWQSSLPAKSLRKRAATTIAENRREAENLRRVFGEMAIRDIKTHHGYDYLDKCDALGRGPKGNKEIALLHLILQRAVRKGIVDINPMRDLEKLPTAPSSRYVADEELDLTMQVGRRVGGASHMAALCLRTGYLCVRRSAEVLDLRVEDINEDGIHWVGGKRQAADFKRAVLISWSPELKAVIDEARSLRSSPSEFVFGTQKGSRYTRGGWKATLRRLMDACVEQAKQDGVSFERFSLQDQRPKGVTDKLAAGHSDTQDATLHSNSKLIDQVYDRRRTRSAKPAR
ncbi:tyrosine-type recombinase/integrase [Piscinibacter sakaiensis]|uniref:tyrosine-type recombinase/integrase n=1 Tax=Piscinibacter sakaiensis TaxID=1547922 RepID=UPI003AADE921